MTELMDTEATKLEEGEEGTAAVPLSEGLGTTVEHAEAPSSTVEHPEAPNPASHLQIDSDHPAIDDGDSAVGSNHSSYSATLSSSVRRYVFENGRRYHAYRSGEYVLPNDDKEQDRLDLNHHCFQLALSGELFRAPITTKPQHVLDLGTGTGIWAIQFADEFPSAQVLGTDLSPIQPSWVPPNCKFLVDDFESQWVFTTRASFDFIHGRTLGGSVKDWDALYRQALHHLKPGGWVEIQEFGSHLYSDDDPELKNAPSVRYWTDLLTEVGIEFGKDFDPDQKKMVEEAGFVDVREDLYKVPVGRWPKDPRLKELGMYQREMVLDSVEPYTLALLTRLRNWTQEECQVLIAKVKGEVKDPSFHGYAKFRFTYGMKPVV